MKLTLAQQDLRKLAMDLSREYRKLEGLLLEVLQQIDQSKLYKKLGFSSLFQYAVNELKFTESVAYGFITVARKSLEVTTLKEAILTQKLSVAKACRMTSALTKENAAYLLEFAQTHTTREVEFEVVKIKPRSVAQERVKLVTEGTVELRLNISKEVFEDLKRAEVLVSQSSGANSSLGYTLKMVLTEYLNRKDPVRRAKRILKKTPKLCARRAIAPTSRRQPLKASEKHQVFARDEGRCTFHDPAGKRCSNQKWVELHHIHPISHGGNNDPSNLTTLCSYHHDLTHQLSLPVDGQINWLRSRCVQYIRSCEKGRC